MVIRGCKSGPEGAPTPPLGLSNRYAALSGDSPAPSADAPAVPARSKADRSQNSTPAALQPLVANNAAGSRHRILREAVLRHSGVLPRPQPVSPAPRADIAAPRPLSPVGPCSVDTAIPLSGSKVPRLSAPRPLFLPTTLIVGDSIIRNTRFFNAATHFFPGATVPVITSKLPGLLRSLPSSIRRVIVHVGTYDTAREQSELIKKDSFHFHFHVTRVSTFLVPSPLGRGVGRFSRLLSLHTWLQSTCTALKFGLINNFDLFWDRSHLFRPDGIHWWGNKMLTANLQHTVQSTSHA